MNFQESLSISLNSYTGIIIKDLHFQSYHFIELFIYFNNFIEKESISEDSFITAHTTLLNPREENEEEIETLSQKIFSVLSSNSEEANIVSLCCYLKKISISTFPEFDVDVLFALLDKDNKGYIEYSDIETLISSFEDFINETNEWDIYANSFSGKKIIKRNLTQNHFFESLKKLFEKAEKIIETRLNIVIEELERKKAPIKEYLKKPTMPVIEGVTVHKKNKATNSRHYTSKDNSPTHQPGDQFNNNNNNNNDSIDSNTEEFPFQNIIIDKRKIEIVKKIKRTSYLYDILSDDFLYEISEYEFETFDKEKFIKVLNEIISRKTSNLLESPIKNMALSMLFQIIDYTHRNKIGFFELIGGVLPLTKLNKEYNIFKNPFKYPHDKTFLILCGYLTLYIKTNEVKDLHIFSEILLQPLHENNIHTLTDLLRWVYKDTGKELQYVHEPYITNISIFPTKNDINLICKTIEQKIKEVKSQFSFEMRSLSIYEMTIKLLKYSFLGVLNAFQLSNFFNEFIGSNCESEFQKKKMINEIMTPIEKNFDLYQNELIDIIHLHAFNMLIFSGKSIEKIQSIFLIHDIGENEAIEYEDLCQYMSFLFNFVLKKTKIEWCDNNTLSKLIVDYIVSQVGNKITLTCLINVSENLSSLFPTVHNY